MLSISSIAGSRECGRDLQGYSKLLPLQAIVYCKLLETASACLLMNSWRLACRDISMHRRTRLAWAVHRVIDHAGEMRVCSGVGTNREGAIAEGGQWTGAQRAGLTHGFMSKQMLSSGWAPKERNIMAMKDTPKKLRASEGTGCWLLKSEPTMSPTTATCTCRTGHEPTLLQPWPANATCISTASTDSACNSQTRWRRTQSP